MRHPHRGVCVSGAANALGISWHMEQIGPILNKVLQQLKNQQEYSVEAIEALWNKCVTKTAARHTKIYSLKKGKLYINIENPAWLYELRTRKRQIIAKLNKVSGNKIKEVFFRVGDTR